MGGRRGDYQAAEPMFHRALEMMEKLLGDDHPFVASNLNNLASILVAYRTRSRT